MAEKPNVYLNDPDALSVLLSRLELSAEVYVNGDFCGSWAVDTGGTRRIPFHLIGRGEAWLHYGEDDARLLRGGDLVVFPRCEHHTIAHSAKAPAPESINAPMSNDGATTNMVCGFFEFARQSVLPLLDALPPVIVVRCRDAEHGTQLSALIDLLLDELSRQRHGFYAAIDRLAFLLFVEVMRQQVQRQDEGAATQGLLAALFDPRIGRALNAIHQRPERPWSLTSLADEARMSRSSFAQRFTALIGMTPGKYLTHWRMSEARRLLRSSDLSTAQIAERSGYESDAAFRKAFKKTLGVTPGAVRRER